MGFFDSSAGGIAGAIGSVAGGILGLGSSAASQASAERLNSLNYQHQKEFAQNGIRWKVADAKAAGLHPLAALGAQTASYTPAGAIGDSPDWSFLSDAGQSIGRAIDAKRTQQEREEQQVKQDAAFALKAENQRAENDLIKAQTDSIRQDMALRLAKSAEESVRIQQQVPAMPSLTDSTVIPGQAQAQTYPSGLTKPEISEVPTTLKGDPSTQAGAPPDSRFYTTVNGRAVLPNEATGDVLDAVPGAGIQYAIRNSVMPYLANFLPINDPRRRPGEYYSLLTGEYRKGGRFRDFFGY